jgi:hypothetical protein
MHLSLRRLSRDKVRVQSTMKAQRLANAGDLELRVELVTGGHWKAVVQVQLARMEGQSKALICYQKKGRAIRR